MATAELVLNRLDDLAQYFRTDWNTRWRMKPPRLLKPPLRRGENAAGSYRPGFPCYVSVLQNFRATLIPTIAVPVVLMEPSPYFTPSVTASTP